MPTSTPADTIEPTVPELWVVDAELSLEDRQGMGHQRVCTLVPSILVERVGEVALGEGHRDRVGRLDAAYEA